jgi:cytochrome d ubiquinol oxidase subunit II
VGLAAYIVLAGADFGAGLWYLLAGPGPRGRPIRDFTYHAMAPVWEANHVWLIFVLVVLWTAFSGAFAAVVTIDSRDCRPLRGRSRPAPAR